MLQDNLVRTILDVFSQMQKQSPDDEDINEIIKYCEEVLTPSTQRFNVAIWSGDFIKEEFNVDAPNREVALERLLIKYANMTCEKEGE